jgi:hypothetical protein
MRTRRKALTRCSAGLALVLLAGLESSFLGAGGSGMKLKGVLAGAAPEPRLSWPSVSVPDSTRPAQNANNDVPVTHGA